MNLQSLARMIGLAIFYGGIAQFLVGMWEFKTGNTFGATAFSSYGAFWLSYAAILVPWFGVFDTYVLYKKEVGSALGIFLLGWALFTLMIWFGTLWSKVLVHVALSGIPKYQKGFQRSCSS
jgi:succinate-acetate transporter protein